MRRMLKTTNPTPQKYSGEGVSISRRRTFRRIESPPHSAISIYVKNDIERITKASVISRKIAFDKPIAKKPFSALPKRHLTQTADSGISHDETRSPSTAAIGKIDREPILLLINFVFWQPHRVFSTSARQRSAALLRLRQLGCLTICKFMSQSCATGALMS